VTVVFDLRNRTSVIPFILRGSDADTQTAGHGGAAAMAWITEEFGARR